MVDITSWYLAHVLDPFTPSHVLSSNIYRRRLERELANLCERSTIDIWEHFTALLLHTGVYIRVHRLEALRGRYVCIDECT